MSDFQKKVQLAVDEENTTLKVGFEPLSSQTIYDICDFQGRILKSGEIESSETKVDLNGLDKEHYILLILDGDRVFTKKFGIGPVD